MAKRTNLRLAVAELGAVAPAFDAVTTFSRPGQRVLPLAFLVERHMLVPDPDQPRKEFNDEKLQELADSIRQIGVLQPLRVRPGEDGKYVIVNGERRWRACLIADVPEIPVLVRDSPADQLAFEMLVENLQREDLTDQEEAAAFKALIDQGYTTEQIAARLGVSKGRVSKETRVYEQPVLAEPVIRGEMTKSQAQELLTAPRDLQRPLAEAVVAARRGGNAVPIGELRRTVRDVKEALYDGRSPEEIMESVSTRNAFRPVRSSVRALRPALVTLNNLAREIEGFCDRHGGTAYTDAEREPLRQAWRRLGALLGEDRA